LTAAAIDPKSPLHTSGTVVTFRAPFQTKANFMRRPKGIKTKKSVAKRFKITGTGKVLRSKAGRRHLLQGKSSKRRRGLGERALVDKTDTYKILQSLPFTR
jgi:large subunit ribosomal protein L35